MSQQHIEISKTELAELISRVEHAIDNDLALSVDDLQLLLAAINTLSSLQTSMEQDNVTMNKLRKLLGIVQSSESRKKKNSNNGNDTSNNNGSNNTNKSPTNNKPKPPSKPPKVIVYKNDYKKGDVCPECSRGKLYKFRAGVLLRVTGHAPFEATKHVTQCMRCNACLKEFKPELPAEVLADGAPEQQYGYTARALMVLNKFYSGLPYYHQENLAHTFGHSITASTLFDQCEYVANDVIPVFNELKRQAATAKKYLIDDTKHKILHQQPEYRPKRNGKGTQLRTGVYSSGLIAVLSNDNEIVLFNTSLGHAGEHLDEILAKRPKELDKPIVMSDALSSNSTKADVINSGCNVHSRRMFFDLKDLYPKKINWVLDEYAKIWKNETHIKENGMDDKARLAYHKEYSLPVMKAIQTWALEQQKRPSFEEHSAFGKAVNYYLRHYDKLVMFCKVPGALIDNNRMEEKLKIVIRGRKTYHFYKTAVGAGVANVLISLIATAHTNNINIYDYLLALQQYKDMARQNPDLWLPWTYHLQIQIIETRNKDGPDQKAA